MRSRHTQQPDPAALRAGRLESSGVRGLGGHPMADRELAASYAKLSTP